MMALCAITLHAQTKELEIQEFEYDGGIYRGESLNGKQKHKRQLISIDYEIYLFPFCYNICVL